MDKLEALDSDVRKEILREAQQRRKKRKRHRHQQQHRGGGDDKVLAPQTSSTSGGDTRSKYRDRAKERRMGIAVEEAYAEERKGLDLEEIRKLQEKRSLLEMAAKIEAENRRMEEQLAGKDDGTSIVTDSNFTYLQNFFAPARRRDHQRPWPNLVYRSSSTVDFFKTRQLPSYVEPHEKGQVVSSRLALSEKVLEKVIDLFSSVHERKASDASKVEAGHLPERDSSETDASAKSSPPATVQHEKHDQAKAEEEEQRQEAGPFLPQNLDDFDIFTAYADPDEM